MDYPGTKDDWDKKAVNSVYENGKIKILFRDLTQTPDFGQKGGTPVSYTHLRMRCSTRRARCYRISSYHLADVWRKNWYLMILQPGHHLSLIHI